ncbi:unnamed protein product [Cuscuta epithymum]|uniref:Uncharacterized protein n=1 Tax=Cuscuta epithymum TaxID=186058 RepID=A0AAV0FDM7_9ASTE|nr:unnamed protein product [Cuscuta epithymum]
MYSEFINLSSAEVVEMLVLDGCFVVEILRASRPADFKLDDADNPLMSITQFILRNCHHDLYCLENQIPYIVLQTLFTLAETEDDECNMYMRSPYSIPGNIHNLILASLSNSSSIQDRIC